ncbi:MAG: hypothetical protein KC553_15040 [Nitrospina sp.]|nr:hypothetical protein [Nitrospina sp.]
MIILGGNKQLEQLVTLQKLDDEVKELQETLALIPGQVEKSRQELETKKARLNRLNTEIEDLKKKRGQCEQDVKSENDHMLKAQQKLPSVKTNKEYSALLAEIDAIKEKISSIEDRELGIMEALDQKEAEIPEAKQEFEGHQKEFDEYKARKDAEAARVQGELDAANKKREDMAATLDPKLVSDYWKIFSRRDQVAVVAMKDGICQGCFQLIRPQVAIEVKSSDKLLHNCHSCHRFLYCEAEPAEDAESAVPK